MTEPSAEEALTDLAWPELPEPRHELRGEIRRACASELSPRRGLSVGARVGLTLALAAGVVLVLALLALGKERPSSAGHAALFGAAGWGVVQAAIVGLALARPGRRAAGGLWLAVALGVPLAFIGYLTLAASSRLPLGEFFRGEHAGGALGCGLHALLFGAIAAAGTLFIWRRTDPFSPALSGGLVGLVGGLTGATAIGIACPAGETWHLWLGHGAAVAMLALAGWLLGRRVLAP